MKVAAFCAALGWFVAAIETGGLLRKALYNMAAAAWLLVCLFYGR